MSVTIKDLKTTLDKLKQPVKSTKPIHEFAEELHDFLRDKMALSEKDKPIMVAGIILALTRPVFAAAYPKAEDNEALYILIIDSIEETLKGRGLAKDKREQMLNQFEAVLGQSQKVKSHLEEVVDLIYSDIFHNVATSTSDYDVLGAFYSEFIKYSGGDGKGLGIVLTPLHICRLFCKLANSGAGLDFKKSTVLDICAGTGGFLIAALAYMMAKAKTESQQERIRKEGLAGIELAQHMFTLLCSNMIFKGDGKSNVYSGDAFDDCIRDKIVKLNPNVVLLNPPYSMKERHELEFIQRALSMLEPGGSLVSIIPMSCVIDQGKKATKLKTELLEEHTLEAVMSMPDQLFPGVGTITCVVVFTAKKPHPKGYRSWFALWKDDGFKLRKGKRIEKKPGLWDATEANWVSTFIARQDKPGYSVLKGVTGKDEWCAEKWLETDSNTITQDLINRKVEDFVNYLVTNDVQV